MTKYVCKHFSIQHPYQQDHIIIYALQKQFRHGLVRLRYKPGWNGEKPWFDQDLMTEKFKSWD